MTNNSVWFVETVALAFKHRQTCSAKVLAETSMVEWVRIFLCISPGFASVFKSPILIHYDAVPRHALLGFTNLISSVRLTEGHRSSLLKYVVIV